MRTLLTWLVLACLLPGITGASALLIYEHRAGRAELERNNLQTARALAVAVDNQILRIQAMAQGLATANSLARGDFASFHERARRALELSGLGVSVAVIDRSGRQILNTLKEYGEPLPVYGNPEIVRRVFASGHFVVSDLFGSTLLSRPLMAVVVPVVLDGEVAYALIVNVLPESFSGILSGQGLPAGWVGTIFDSRGVIAARSRASDFFVGQQPAEGYYRRLMEKSEGTFEAVMKDGVPVLSAYARSPVAGWRVAVNIPQQALENELAQSFTILFAGIVGLFAIGLGVAWLLGGKIARSFQALISPAFALGAGKSFAFPVVEVKEAAGVIAALGEAAALLEKRAADLNRAAETLRDSERRLELALSASGSVAWELDVASGAIASGDRLGTLYGYAPGELRTLADWEGLIHEDDRPGIVEKLDDAVAGRSEAFSCEARLRRKDGSWRWNLSHAVVPERDSAGRALRLVGTHTDITESKAAAAEIQRLNAELEQRVRERTAELELANEKLLHTNMELQHFAHATAHDLQTPLRSIAGFTQLVQRAVKPQGDPQVEEWAEQAVANTRRLQTLIQELLNYTRLDAQGMPFAEVDMDALVAEVLGSLQGLICNAGAEVCSEPLPRVVADRTQMSQLLQNLIENGIKYNRSRPPRVSLSCGRDEGGWLFSVADNGIGIEPRHHEHIFDIFKRLHSYHQIPGTGIGLALCRRIVERHGGRIWVESRPGGGSTFRFTLPDRRPAGEV